MIKLLRASFTYMIVGMLSGVYYREFTKINDFTGDTQLSTLHTHLLVLGALFFLLLLILEKNFHITEQKQFKLFSMLYHSGFGITILMMTINGTRTVLGLENEPALAGIAGLGHIIMFIALIMLYVVLNKAVKDSSK